MIVFHECQIMAIMSLAASESNVGCSEGLPPVKLLGNRANASIIDAMSLYHFSMKTRYFLERAELLKRQDEPDTGRAFDFVRLKVREYWIRAMGRYPRMFACEDVLPLCQGKEFLDALESLKGALGRGRTSDAHLSLARDICASTLEVAKADGMVDYSPLVDVLKELRSAAMARCRSRLVRDFRHRGLEMLAQAEILDDAAGKRLDSLREQFSLDEHQMEIVLAAWLGKHDSQAESLVDLLLEKLPGSNSYASAAPVILRTLTGIPSLEMEKYLDRNSQLRQLGLLDNDLDLESEIVEFLDGRVSGNLQERYFRLWAGEPVPLEELKPNSIDMDMLYEMCKHRNLEQGVNVLLYGMEGTGKTELSHALSAKLGIPLYIVGEDSQAIREEKALMEKDRVIRYRLRALHVALSQTAKERCALLMDEADTVLGVSEKGMLNHLLDKSHGLVIWIANSLEGAEKSTLRRFDYSLYFGPLEAKQRQRVWESVAKKQKAQGVLTVEEIQEISRESPVMAGGATQAVIHAKRLLEAKSGLSPSLVARRVAQSQARLLGIDEPLSRPELGLENAYACEALNIKGDLREVCESVRGFYAYADSESSFKGTLGILLWGAPGTGKTEFARFLAKENNRELVTLRASDILGCYVGETEKRIRELFRSAEERKAVLFIDEADGLLRTREGASKGWEVTQVNEMLVRMERYAGVLVAATNFPSSLDSASRRRFAWRLGFDYLRADGIALLWERFFEKAPLEREVLRLSSLSPGDFAAVHRRLRFLPKALEDGARIARELRLEADGKEEKVDRVMGFSAKEAC